MNDTFAFLGTAYNIFMKANMNPSTLHRTADAIATAFRFLASPARLALILAIGEGEACVCHLVALFGWRQAYISQHLMALRNEGLLETRRDGKYIYYRLSRPAVLALVRQAAETAGVSLQPVIGLDNQPSSVSCECPRCAEKLPASPAGLSQVNIQ
jgi:ArsR family transcriptional regulator